MNLADQPCRSVQPLMMIQIRRAVSIFYGQSPILRALQIFQVRRVPVEYVFFVHKLFPLKYFMHFRQITICHTRVVVVIWVKRKIEIGQ